MASAQRLITNADEMTAKAAMVRWHINLGLDKYEGELFSATAGLRIIPNEERYYEGGITYFNQGLPWTAQDTSLTGYIGYNAWLAWRVLGSPFFFRGGIKSSSVAAGLDFRLGDLITWLPVEFTVDSYRYGDPRSQLDLGASLAFLKDFRLTGGAADVLNRPEYHVGMTLIYDDEDFTDILVKIKTGLLGGRLCVGPVSAPGGGGGRGGVCGAESDRGGTCGTEGDGDVRTSADWNWGAWLWGGRVRAWGWAARASGWVSADPGAAPRAWLSRSCSPRRDPSPRRSEAERSQGICLETRGMASSTLSPLRVRKATRSAARAKSTPPPPHSNHSRERKVSL